MDNTATEAGTKTQEKPSEKEENQENSDDASINDKTSVAGSPASIAAHPKSDKAVDMETDADESLRQVSAKNIASDSVNVTDVAMGDADDAVNVADEASKEADDEANEADDAEQMADAKNMSGTSNVVADGKNMADNATCMAENETNVADVVSVVGGSSVARMADDASNTADVESGPDDASKVTEEASVADDASNMAIVASVADDASKVAEEAIVVDDAYNMADLESLPDYASKVTEEASMADDASNIANVASVVDDTSKVAEEASVADDASKVTEEAFVADDASKVAEEASVADDASEMAEEANVADDASKGAEETGVADDASIGAKEASVAVEASEFAEETSAADDASDVADVESMADNSSKVADVASVADDSSEIADEASGAGDATEVADAASVADDECVEAVYIACVAPSETNLSGDSSDKADVASVASDAEDMADVVTNVAAKAVNDVDKVATAEENVADDEAIVAYDEANKPDDEDKVVADEMDVVGDVANGTDVISNEANETVNMAGNLENVAAAAEANVDEDMDLGADDEDSKSDEAHTTCTREPTDDSGGGAGVNDVASGNEGVPEDVNDEQPSSVNSTDSQTDVNMKNKSDCITVIIGSVCEDPEESAPRLTDSSLCKVVERDSGRVVEEIQNSTLAVPTSRNKSPALSGSILKADGHSPAENLDDSLRSIRDEILMTLESDSENDDPKFLLEPEDIEFTCRSYEDSNTPKQRTKRQMQDQSASPVSAKKHKRGAGRPRSSLKDVSTDVQTNNKETSSDVLEPFKHGWTRILKYRRAGTLMADAYYFYKNSKPLRSRNEVMAYIEENDLHRFPLSCFSFSKSPVHKEPYEYILSHGDSINSVREILDLRFKEKNGDLPVSVDEEKKISEIAVSASPKSPIGSSRKKVKIEKEQGQLSEIEVSALPRSPISSTRKKFEMEKEQDQPSAENVISGASKADIRRPGRPRKTIAGNKQEVKETALRKTENVTSGASKSDIRRPGRPPKTVAGNKQEVKETAWSKKNVISGASKADIRRPGRPPRIMTGNKQQGKGRGWNKKNVTSGASKINIMRRPGRPAKTVAVKLFGKKTRRTAFKKYASFSRKQKVINKGENKETKELNAENVRPELLEPFKHGWKRVVNYTSGAKPNVCYIHPKSKPLWCKKYVMAFIKENNLPELPLSCFCFSDSQISEEPHEYILKPSDDFSKLYLTLLSESRSEYGDQEWSRKLTNYRKKVKDLNSMGLDSPRRTTGQCYKEGCLDSSMSPVVMLTPVVVNKDSMIISSPDSRGRSETKKPTSTKDFESPVRKSGRLQSLPQVVAVESIKSTTSKNKDSPRSEKNAIDLLSVSDRRRPSNDQVKFSSTAMRRKTKAVDHSRDNDSSARKRTRSEESDDEELPRVKRPRRSKCLIIDSDENEHVDEAAIPGDKASSVSSEKDNKKTLSEKSCNKVLRVNLTQAKLNGKATTKKSKVGRPKKGRSPHKINVGQAVCVGMESQSDNRERVCDLKCRGLEGVAPTMYCIMCMVAVHPQCVHLQPDDEYTCYVCSQSDCPYDKDTSPSSDKASSLVPPSDSPVESDCEDNFFDGGDDDDLSSERSAPARPTPESHAATSSPCPVSTVAVAPAAAPAVAPAAALAVAPAVVPTVAPAVVPAVAPAVAPVAIAPPAPKPCMVDAESQTVQTRQSQHQIHCLHAGFSSLLHIFSYLPIHDLFRAGRVCKLWKKISEHPDLNRFLVLRDVFVRDWCKLSEFVCEHGVRKLDLRGLVQKKGDAKSWSSLDESLYDMLMLRELYMGLCPCESLTIMLSKCPRLRVISAVLESTVDDSDMRIDAVLDLRLLTKIKCLEELSISSTDGMRTAAVQADCITTVFNDMPNLRKLSITSLNMEAMSNRCFVNKFTRITSLEFGKCLKWTEEHFKSLAILSDLETLRLECGQDSYQNGLAYSLKHLNRLKVLQLIRFNISLRMVTVLQGLESLEEFCIWPDTFSVDLPFANACTLTTVSKMRFLKSFEWGIITSSSDGTTKIPFFGWKAPHSSWKSLFDPGTQCDFVAIEDLVDKVGSYLGNTRFRVYRVPGATSIYSGNGSSQSFAQFRSAAGLE